MTNLDANASVSSIVPSGPIYEISLRVADATGSKWPLTDVRIHLVNLYLVSPIGTMGGSGGGGGSRGSAPPFWPTM